MSEIPILAFEDCRTNPIDISVQYSHMISGPLTIHRHNFYEIVYIKKGSGLHQINDVFYTMLMGDIYIMSPNDIHSATLDKSLSIVNILFQPTLFNEKDWSYLKDLPGLNVLKNSEKKDCLHKLALSPCHSETIRSLYIKIYLECKQKDPGWEVSARNGCAEILINMSRAWITYGSKSLQTYLTQGPISRALQIIYENWDKEIKVNELAEKVFLSKNYFGELFQNEVGMTVQQYINKLKIDHARLLLEDSSLSISDIADTIGYHDNNYFSRVFKKIYCG